MWQEGVTSEKMELKHKIKYVIIQKVNYTHDLYKEWFYVY